VKLIHGKCPEAIKELADNSVDSIVTDPPYGLKFMGKKWDHGVPSVAIWKECYRILKPGGYLLSFAGTRTQHRMAVNIEDAGFEIRDMIAWVYGSGFPKSLNISKAIDKAAGAERCKINTGKPAKRMIPGADQDKTGSWIKDNGREFQPGIELPATEDAEQWDGWGTALKPALEPITLARKPLSEKTVAANVLKYGTGGINIDGCRIGTDGGTKRSHQSDFKSEGVEGNVHATRGYRTGHQSVDISKGRFPANLIHDGSDDVVELFPDSKSVKGKARVATIKNQTRLNNSNETQVNCEYSDSGSAARFFYCAKASRKERNRGLENPGPQFKHGTVLRNVENTETKGNTHPTVKPIALMRYLCRLVTPKGGTVLDPFMGSGSTGCAAKEEGFDFIGIDQEIESVEIAAKRIKKETDQLKLF